MNHDHEKLSPFDAVFSNFTEVGDWSHLKSDGCMNHRHQRDG